MKTTKFPWLVIGLVAGLAGCNSNDEKVITPPPPMNSAPTTSDVTLTTQTDQTVATRLEASDADGDSLSFSVAMMPTLGTVELMDNGEFVYTPPLETTGSDSFSFIVSDGNNGQASGTVSIVIETLELDIALYSRLAFQQAATDIPLAVNGRTFLENNDDDFADLLVD